MLKRLTLMLAAVLACTTVSLAAGQSCPPLVFQTAGFGMQQMETPCVLDLINPANGCINCPGRTVFHQDGTPYCQGYASSTPGAEQFGQIVSVPQHRVNGKCVPDYTVQAFAKPAAAKPVRVGSPVRVASPVTRAAAPQTHVAPPPAIHFVAPPMHFSAPVIHAALPPPSGHPGKP